MDVLAFPFRLSTNGSFVKVSQGSLDHLSQQAVQFASTRPTELPLALSYGLDDPTFRTVSKEEVIAGLGLYHPSVKVRDVTIVQTREGNTEITVDVDQPTTTYTETTEASVTFNA